MKHLLIVFIFLYCIKPAFSQSIHLKMYSSNDGLSNNVVRNVTQDKFGQIWIGTEYGLNLFDGIHFSPFLHSPSDTNSLSNNFVFGLDTDQQGIVWVGTDGGLNAYDASTKKFTRFLHSEDSLTISDDHVRVVFVDRENNVWVGTEDGLNVFQRSDSTFLRFKDDRIFENKDDSKNLSFNRINSITQTLDGKIWIGTDGGGVKIYKNGSSTFQTIFLPNNQSTHLFNIVRTIFQENDSTMWFGCDGGLVSLHQNGEYKTFYPNEHQDSLGYKYIWSAIQLSDDLLWFGSYGGGLFEYDKVDKKFTSHKVLANRDDSYENNLIWPLFKDYKGNMWIGFDGVGGLGYYNPESKKFDHLLGSKSSEEKYNVSHIYEISPDSLIVGTSKERFLLVNGTKKTSLDQLFAGFSTKPITIPIKGGYIFTGNDILIVSDSNFKVKYRIEDEEIGMIRCGIQDGNGIVWLGSLSSGLIRLDTSTRSIKRFFAQGHLKIYSDSRSISSIYSENDSILWLGPTRYGLIRFNKNTENYQQFLFNSQGFKTPTINSIVKQSNGNLLLGTKGNGLINFDPETQNARRLRHLETDLVQSIVLDDEDRFWISTNRGLNMIDHSFDSVVRFGLDDGLQSMIFNQNGHFGESGKIYFGGENGINRFNPDIIRLSSETPPLLITNIKISDKYVGWSLREPISSLSQIDLASDENDIQIEFTSNNYLHTSTHQFEYTINDEVWRSLGKQKILNLTNLAPGDYVINLRSLNHDYFASPSKTIKVHIKPPWYDTIVFKIVLAFTLFAGAAAIYRYRLLTEKSRSQYLESQVLERTHELELSKQQVENDKLVIEKSLKERESLLKEIHHRVKNNLQIIASLLYLQSGKFEDEDFKKVLEEGQGRVRSMALIHQKLYENDDLKSIPFGEYLRELVGEIRASFGMANVQLNIEAEGVFFDVDTAVPLGLIVNEMATNAFKYAYHEKQKGTFSIFLTEENGQYLLNVKDDGKGIPDEIDIRKTKSLGLRLVRMLSQQLEGDFEFKSDNGTSFELKFAA